MKLTTTVELDEISSEIAAMFDHPFTGSIDFVVPSMPAVDGGFGIGAIVGASGSGKSSILRSFGSEQKPQWAENKSIASHFASAKDAETMLTAAGLNSIPSWLKPYWALSTGEKFRADVARSLRSGCVIDEFTSTVDRNTAKSCANSIRRYVDAYGINGVVVATCHRDILDWLRPDWCFDTESGQMLDRGSFRRPPVDVSVSRCGHDLWQSFKNHHYLSGDINKSARCWVARIDGQAAGFAAAIAFPNGNFANAWRGHRTVVKPEFQGIGLGVRLSDFVAAELVAEGKRYFSKTSHPKMGAYRDRSPLWAPTSKNKKRRPDYSPERKSKEDGHKMAHAGRLCWSHEFVWRPDER